MTEADVAQRFAEVDGYIAEMDRRLAAIARQNATLAEMVEVLGGYVNATIDRLQHHVENHDQTG